MASREYYIKQLFNYNKVNHIKKALIITNKDLKKTIDWRKDQQVNILVKECLRLVNKKKFV